MPLFPRSAARRGAGIWFTRSLNRVPCLNAWGAEGGRKTAELSRLETVKDVGQWQKLFFFLHSKAQNLLSPRAGRYGLVCISLHYVSRLTAGSHWKNTTMSLGMERVSKLHGLGEMVGAQCTPSLTNNRSSPLNSFNVEITWLEDVSTCVWLYSASSCALPEVKSLGVFL